MKNDILYKKVGRKYIPVKEIYNYDGLQAGHWLLHIQPGSTSLRYKLNPEYPNLIAAIEEYKDFLAGQLQEASKLRPMQTKMSRKEIKAWENLKKELGEDIPRMFCGYVSLHDMVEEALDKLKEKIYPINNENNNKLPKLDKTKDSRSF